MSDLKTWTDERGVSVWQGFVFGQREMDGVDLDAEAAIEPPHFPVVVPSPPDHDLEGHDLYTCTCDDGNVLYLTRVAWWRHVVG